MKKIVFTFLLIVLSSCSTKTSKFSEPKVTFSNKYITIENQSDSDYYNIEIKFADKYILKYLSQAKKSKIQFSYKDIKPSSTFLELNKNKYVINYQDSVGNNYEVFRNKLIYKNNEKTDNTNYLEDLNKVLSSSSGITILLALLAAFVALHQVKSNVISSSRIKWIEEFKNDVSEHSTAVRQMIYNYGMHLKYYNENEDPKIKNYVYYDEYIKCHYKASIHESNLRMNLNLDEHLYKEIKNTLDQITKKIDNFNSEIDTDQTYREASILLNRLRDQSQKALKIEWKKSRKMFYYNYY